MQNEFLINFRVYIEDTDAGGVVYHGNYLKYMERARTELLRSVGVPKAAALESGLLFVVVSASVNYKKPALLDDELTISAQISKRARTYLIFEQKIYRKNQCICDGQIKIACVDKNSFKLSAIPDTIIKAVEARYGPAK